MFVFCPSPYSLISAPPKKQISKKNNTNRAAQRPRVVQHTCFRASDGGASPFLHNRLGSSKASFEGSQREVGPDRNKSQKQTKQKHGWRRFGTLSKCIVQLEFVPKKNPSPKNTNTGAMFLFLFFCFCCPSQCSLMGAHPKTKKQIGSRGAQVWCKTCFVEPLRAVQNRFSTTP